MPFDWSEIPIQAIATVLVAVLSGVFALAQSGFGKQARLLRRLKGLAEVHERTEDESARGAVAGLIKVYVGDMRRIAVGGSRPRILARAVVSASIVTFLLLSIAAAALPNVYDQLTAPAFPGVETWDELLYRIAESVGRALLVILSVVAALVGLAIAIALLWNGGRWVWDRTEAWRLQRNRAPDRDA